MKNIHVLPTDKPSKLYFNHNKEFEKYQFSKEPFINGLTNTTNQHIYITSSDEEIKEGDWCYHPLLKGGSIIQSKFDNPNSTMKKIILTTDQYLIRDGVQAIDDEFLEWFVNNPSCEWVEVLFACRGLNGHTPIGEYRIIIPKEEPKQDLEKEMFDLEQELDIPPHLRWHNSKSKQEITLEEVAENELRKQSWDTTITLPFNGGFIEGFQQGYKLAQQRIQNLRDELYNDLPIGEVNSFELIKLINNHIKKLDELI